MAWFFCFVFCLVALALFWRVQRLNRLLGELEGAVRSKRRLLSQDTAQTLRRIGALGLIDSLNELIDAHKRYEVRSSDNSSQFGAILESVQEAVVVFDDERLIKYTNKAAEDLLRTNRPLRGLRLERVLRSLSLLELLDHLGKDTRAAGQVTIERGGEVLWFEASCAHLADLDDEAGSTSMLVLHNITELKHLEVMRREFVANVSHELRTPLTIIKGFAETLIDDDSTINTKARLRFLGKILNNSERLHVLVEDLLTLSRLESKPEQIELITQPIDPFFKDVAENYRPRLSDEQSFQVEVAPSLDSFPFDRYRINQVLDNLIENIFRYAPDFSKITLRAEYHEDENFVCCSVIDDGPGIPPQDVPHLFERFYRVDKGRSRETGGTGLGLSIVKHIVQLHGGTIYAESELGKGTAIRFSIPYHTDRSAVI